MIDENLTQQNVVSKTIFEIVAAAIKEAEKMLRSTTTVHDFNAQFKRSRGLETLLQKSNRLVPDDSPSCEQEHYDRAKTAIERGMQWAIGDWYNAIPHVDKEAACKRAGLNFNTASEYGRVAACFPIPIRMGNAPFKYHQTIANQQFTLEQRAGLLEKSSKNAWTLASLTRERDKLLGKPERVPVQYFGGQVQAVLNQLPASASKKVQRDCVCAFPIAASTPHAHGSDS